MEKPWEKAQNEGIGWAQTHGLGSRLCPMGFLPPPMTLPHTAVWVRESCTPLCLQGLEKRDLRYGVTGFTSVSLDPWTGLTQVAEAGARQLGTPRGELFLGQNICPSDLAFFS